METVGSGSYQNGQLPVLPSKAEAVKTAGFGNERTARRATKAIDNGIPELVEKLGAEEVSVSGEPVLTG